MKVTYLIPFLILLFFDMLHAAPRLVVSTPSLLPGSEIDVIFDQPMVTREQLGKEVDNNLITISPPLSCKLFWKAPGIAGVRAQELVQIGTEYSFSANAGLKHLDGSAVEPGPFAKVSTEDFRIHTARSPNRWASDYSAATGSWMIVFNDEVDLSSLGAFFSFRSERNQQIAPQLRYATADDAGYFRTSYLTWKNYADPEKQREEMAPESVLKNIVIVAPVSPLPVAKKWELRMLAGLPNASGAARLASDVSYQIGEVEPFQVSKISADVEVDTPRQITIRFNQGLPEAFPGGVINVVPEPGNMALEVDGKSLIITGDFSQADRYVVMVASGLESVEKQLLNKSATSEVKFERLEPELALPSGDEAQLALGRREYELNTVSLSAVKVRIKMLSGKGLIRTYQGYRNYSGRGPDYTDISPTSVIPYSLVPGETVVEKEIPLDNAVDTGRKLHLSWDELLPADQRYATFFLDVIGVPHPDSGASGQLNSQAVIQLTDIGLAWKFSDESALLFAFSCDSGKPLDQVKIRLFGEDAEVLGEVLTDENGLADVTRGEAVRHLQATLGGDAYTVAFDRSLDRVGMWHFPVRYSWMKALPETRRAFMFTDRSLYRPGEKVRIKGIVRNQLGNAIAHSKKAPARIAIIDPTEKEIFTQAVEISELGSFDLTYRLPDSQTGDHIIRLEFPEDLELAKNIKDWEKQAALESSASFSLDLKVEEFRRNAFELAQKIDPPAVGARELTAKLTATYYQGLPVAAGAASTFSEVTAVNPYPERFRDYLFGDHRVDDWRYWYNYFGYRDDDADNEVTGTSFESDQVLSNQGFAELSVKIPAGDFPSAQEVSIATEVTDANHQTLTAQSTVTVHPADYYAGISRLDRLVRVGGEVPFRLVVTDAAGEPAEVDIPLSVVLSREVHTHTKVTNADGDTVTESERSEEVVATKEVVVSAADSAGEGLTFPVTPANIGLHFLTVKGRDAAGREFATVIRFHVYGAEEYPWKYEDGMRIKLVSEKKSYLPGETARVLVLSPIEGTALVTVEREKVLSSYLTEIKAENPVIEISLSDDHAPNAYVSVLIVKGAAESAREIKEPQLRLGYCELTVKNVRDRLAVQLNPAGESYRPATEATVSGRVTLADGTPAAGAEVTLYAVDEGTLAVMGYDTPDPMAHFYEPRDLSIDAGTSFHSFLSENADMRVFSNKGFFVGGGGDLNKLAEIFRKNFDPCAAWAPAVVTAADGSFSHSFTLPDTLTRYRVIAVAHHSGAAFGHGESALVVKKPLMLEPKLPRFAHQGDLVTTQVMVQNASGRAATWEVTCSTADGENTSSATLEGAPRQSVTLDPDGSAVLTFPVRINDTGTIRVSYSARPLSLADGGLTPQLEASLSDAVSETFISNFPMPLLRQLVSRRLPGGTEDLRSLLDENLSSATGSVELDLASSPLVNIASSVEYLLTYPYGCAEQTSSAMMPWFAVKNLRPYVPAFSGVSDKKIADAIQVGVARLLGMQLADGSFSYWPGSTETNGWVTPYASMALVLASQNGASVPPSSLQKASQYLIASLRGAGESKSSAELENHARTLYTLALLGQPQASYHALMTEKLPFMTAGARSLLAASIALGSEGRPKVLGVAKGVLDSPVKFHQLDQPDYWGPDFAADAAKLIALLAIDPSSEAGDKALDKLLNDRNPYGHWRNTWMNGWSLYAVSQYAAARQHDAKEIQLSLRTADGERTIQLSRENPAQTVSIPLTPSSMMELKASAPVFLRMKVAGKPPIAPLAAVAKNGLSIERFYEKVLSNGQTEVLKNPALGDLIRVTLQVTLPRDDSRYLIVEDPLPSIFETVNSEFSSQTSAQSIRTSEDDWSVSHSELRSDRAVFFMDHVWKKGTYKLTYLARCTIAGDVNTPPAKVESMYEPENFALSASQTFSAK
ncbi:alpha-2-macroglobulin [Luteolibacter algae]|uniref:Alpha-2-macroglobulin n=1 Tax=Luteolibacter algae TaxID=454151 RepID=A0ABW5D8F2_9BACT